MSNKADRRPVRPFTTAVARHMREILRKHSLTQKAVAEVVERDQSYISERVSGKRPFSTDDIDAIAQMIGSDGRSLLLKIAKLLESDPEFQESEKKGRKRSMSPVASINDRETLGAAANTREAGDDEREILAGTE